MISRPTLYLFNICENVALNACLKDKDPFKGRTIHFRTFIYFSLTEVISRKGTGMLQLARTVMPESRKQHLMDFFCLH